MVNIGLGPGSWHDKEGKCSFSRGQVTNCEAGLGAEGCEGLRAVIPREVNKKEIIASAI